MNRFVRNFTGSVENKKVETALRCRTVFPWALVVCLCLGCTLSCTVIKEDDFEYSVDPNIGQGVYDTADTSTDTDTASDTDTATASASDTDSAADTSTDTATDTSSDSNTALSAN